jgi:enhancing lycopene biosynthesis protein 2
MTRVGVVLCGAGRFDGSEIHESVLTLLHLRRGGAQVLCFAPDAPQWATCEHFTGEAAEEPPRNQLAESARIARGDVRPLAQADAGELDALVLPGGSGAARNLCSFVERGAAGTVVPDLQRLLEAMRAAGKPIGAICIAPAILALAFRDQGLRMTLGPATEGPAVAAAAAGHELIAAAVDEIVVDENANVVSTPAYILGPDVAAVDLGIGRLVAEVLRRAAAPR